MKTLVCGLFLLLFTACGQKPPPAAPAAGTEIQWVDVRTSREFADAHIEGALNLPYDQITEEHPLLMKGALKKDALLRVYCRSGRRSAIAKDRLESLGYQVQDVGGFSAAQKLAAADSD